MAKKSCGAFCSFCGACGRDVSGMFNKALVPKDVLPPGAVAPAPAPAPELAARGERGATPKEETQ